MDLSQEVLPWRTGGVVAYSWVERDTKVWGKGRGCLGVSKRVTKSSGEEVIKSIVRLEIRAYEANTYVKVGWLPGWRRRKRERDQAAAVTQQSISWNRRHTTQIPDCHQPSARKRSRYVKEQIGRMATAASQRASRGGWMLEKKKVKGLDRWRAMNNMLHTRNILSLGHAAPGKNKG